MKGKIAIEEAVTLPQLAYQAAFHAPPGREDELVSDLMDIHSQRLERMDKYGVEYMILSVTSPGAQGFGDKAEAEAFAKEANDYLSKEAAKNPKRFGAFCVRSFAGSELMIGTVHARCKTSGDGIAQGGERIGFLWCNSKRLSDCLTCWERRHLQVVRST
jgi:hypothetical protein